MTQVRERVDYTQKNSCAREQVSIPFGNYISYIAHSSQISTNWHWTGTREKYSTDT